MKISKKIIDKTFQKLGYISTQSMHEQSKSISYNYKVCYENFVNLSHAYEHRLNLESNLVEENENRPKLLSRLLGTPPSQAYFILQALAKCKNIPGDVCEFGVAQGETSALIANEILSTDKKLYLYDSFEGLPQPTEKDQLKDDIFNLGSMEAYAGTMSCPESNVQNRLNSIAFPRQRLFINKGFIDKNFQYEQKLPEKVSFAYLDFDFYEPIKLTLQFLHQKTSIGSIIIVDDYDFFSTGSKTAVDEFIDETNKPDMIYEFTVPDKIYGCFAILTRVQ